MEQIQKLYFGPGKPESAVFPDKAELMQVHIPSPTPHDVKKLRGFRRVNASCSVARYGNTSVTLSR
jgi:hypothetical protein